MKQRFSTLVLFFFAFFLAMAVHYANHVYLGARNSDLLRENASVITSDDASYLAPADNWLNGKKWKSNAAGNASIASRSPGYGLFYAFFKSFLPLGTALKLLVIFQILLFALSVILIPKIGLLLKLNSNLSWIIAITVAVLPTFSGFLSYTLTEAVTPALTIIFLYALLRSYRFPETSVLPIAAVLALLIVVRPAMIIWIFSVLLLAVSHFRETTFNKLSIIGVLALVPIIIWQCYISVETEKIQGLHPIYHRDSNDLYRPLHKHIWNFHKSWGQTGTAFNSSVNRLWTDALHDRNPKQTIEGILRSTNPKAVKLIGYDSLQRSYMKYFQILQAQVPFYKSNKSINFTTARELELSHSFVHYRKAFENAFPFYSYILVPVKVYIELGAHSNLSLYIFQQTFRGNIFIEALRYLSFCLHFGIFICFPVAVFLKRKSVIWLSVAIPVLIYLVYLCVVQRGVEERYTIPVLIPMMLLVVAASADVFNKFRHFDPAKQASGI